MEILGMEKVSFVDYENKICATLFTGGCNFSCPFCHNSGIVQKDYDHYTEEEILDYLKSRTKLLDAVTISGGEPTLQPDLKEFIKKIRNLGYSIKLDTNGTRPEILKDLIDNNLLNYVAMDIKNNFENYSPICGVPNYTAEKVKESLKILQKSNIPYELRTTLVSEFHNDENIEKLAKDLKGEKILYLQKFVSKDTCFDKNLHEVAKNIATNFKEVLSGEIGNVILRGY